MQASNQQRSAGALYRAVSDEELSGACRGVKINFRILGNRDLTDAIANFRQELSCASNDLNNRSSLLRGNLSEGIPLASGANFLLAGTHLSGRHGTNAGGSFWVETADLRLSIRTQGQGAAGLFDIYLNRADPSNKNYLGPELAYLSVNSSSSNAQGLSITEHRIHAPGNNIQVAPKEFTSDFKLITALIIQATDALRAKRLNHQTSFDELSLPKAPDPT